MIGFSSFLLFLDKNIYDMFYARLGRVDIGGDARYICCRIYFLTEK